VVGDHVHVRRDSALRALLCWTTDIAPAKLRRHVKALVAAQDCHLIPSGGCCRAKESSMSKAGLDNRHRNHDGEISHKHGNTLVRTLRYIYGQRFAAGYPDTEKLSDILLQLNETSLSQLRRDHETGHLEHKIANASK
jgi:hypothetical protein